jgi:hypothetical protein
MSVELFSFNGIHGGTGKRLFEDMDLATVAGAALGAKLGADQVADVKEKLKLREDHHGVMPGVDLESLASAGWGVVFSQATPAAVREALGELLRHRKEQAGELYKELVYEPGETKIQFLANRKAPIAGLVNPAKMPYYLMLVGPPTEIPFEFQYELDVQYAVGRVDFDTPEEYARYGAQLIAADRGEVLAARRAAYFGPAHPDDRSTQISSTLLVEPLAKAAPKDWDVRHYGPLESTRAALDGILEGGDTPGFLLAAGHGAGYDHGDSRQRALTGAFTCQDWPGPKYDGPVRDFFYAGEDLNSGAKLRGMVMMLFACYGGGLPELDNYSFRREGKPPGRLAAAPFVTELPRRMLGRADGALAVVCHVDRAFETAFRWKKQSHIETFQSFQTMLLQGLPVGAAMEAFNTHYAELAAGLTRIHDMVQFQKRPDREELSLTWLACNDARNYIVLGDPFARLRTKEVAKEAPVVQEEPLVVAEYGLFSDVRESASSLSASVERMVERVSAAVGRAVEDLTTLEVKTYTSADGTEEGARLRASTKIKLEGSSEVIVPERDGAVDDAVWKIHCEAVAMAVENRAKMMQIATNAAAALLGSVKK